MPFDLVAALKEFYRRAYVSEARNRVQRMDKACVALGYATSGNRDLAFEIAKELGLKP